MESTTTQQQGTPNWKNRTLFQGDNLHILRAMNSNSVHLIATDPPFNKGRDFHATPDSLADGASFQDRWSWENDVHEEWIDNITDDFPKVMYAIQSSRSAYGDDMGAFLCFMAVRLLEMHRILRDDGSIYLHCDTTASHYLKELMDAIFGRKNFRNEIVWCYKTGGASSNYFAKKHDILLFYSKSTHFIFNNLKEKSYQGVGYSTGNKNVTLYNDQNAHTRGPYTLVNTKDWWQIPMLATSDKTERTGYPTQKPLALYERIITSSSNKGHIVLDPFAGCATTCVAAEKRGRQWVGIDIWNKAQQIVIERLEKTDLHRTEKTKTTLFSEKMYFISQPPVRTDDTEEVVPFLKTTLKVDEPKGKRMSRAELLGHLLNMHGCKCQGCDRVFDDPRYLALDHNTPRSDGGINHISNRILLCGPCNILKSNTLTLSGLRRENKKRGYMVR